MTSHSDSHPTHDEIPAAVSPHPVEISSLEYETPKEEGPVRRNSINLASLFRGPQDGSANEDGTENQSQVDPMERRNSFNVASFMRSKEQPHANPDPPQTPNYWGTRPRRISLHTIRRHTHTRHLHSLQEATMSIRSDVTEDLSLAVFTVPEFDHEGEEVDLFDQQTNDNDDHHHRSRRHLAVTFGAYHDDHNDEVIPELVQVASNADDASQSTQGNENTAFDALVHKFQELLAETPPSVQIVATFGACLFCHALLKQHAEMDLQVVTMVLVTLCGATFPHLITAAACGVYAGSVSPQTLPSLWWVALLGVLTSAVWQLVSKHKLMLGLGGRLGASAFVAMNLTAVVAFGLDSSVSFGRYYNNSFEFSWEEVLVSTAACIFLASTSGYMRLVAQVPVNPVLLPSAWALFCMLAVSLNGDYQYNASIFGGLAVGAYVGMSSASKLSSFYSFLAVGLVAAIWMQLLRPVCIGFGGKSGFTAMVGVVTYELVQKGGKHLCRQLRASKNTVLPK